jgi:arabinofuranosyltransferase
VALAPGSGVVLEAYTIGLASMSAGADVRVFDLLGLADPYGSRIAADPGRRIGHQKYAGRPFLFARAPLADDAVLPAGVGRDEVEAARRALRCPEAQELLDAVQEPLTPGRALRNLVRAPALTARRFPCAASGG